MKTERKKILAFHFTQKPHKQSYDAGSIPPVGVPLIYQGKEEIELCRRGYHASMDPFDAVRHVSGRYVHLVECSGDIIMDERNYKSNPNFPNKLVCSQRTVLEGPIDVSHVYSVFARTLALNLQNMWPMPDSMKHYLRTDENHVSAYAESKLLKFPLSPSSWRITDFPSLFYELPDSKKIWHIIDDAVFRYRLESHALALLAADPHFHPHEKICSDAFFNTIGYRYKAAVFYSFLSENPTESTAFYSRHKAVASECNPSFVECNAKTVGYMRRLFNGLIYKAIAEARK